MLIYALQAAEPHWTHLISEDFAAMKGENKQLTGSL